METPTQLVSLDELDKPVLQTEDTTFPAPNSTDINPINGLRTDYRSADTQALTDEELASHGVGVSNDPPPITPHLTKEMGLRRQLFRDLLEKQGSSPPVSPQATEGSIVTTPTTAIDVGEPTHIQPTRDIVSAYGTDSPDSGSELDESDVIFSPPITPGLNSPPTPASDVDDYFPHVSVSDGENSADQTLSKLSLPETTDWRSLDTVLPENDYPEKIAQERSAALAEPAMMMTPDLPDPSSNLENFDLDELEVAPSESPPPSRTPSPTPSGASSLVLLAVRRDGSVSKLPFDVVSVKDGSIVVSKKSS